MKKITSIISSIILCFMVLITPLAFAGCIWDKNENTPVDDSPKVEYSCTSYTQTKLENEEDSYKYTFKVEITNNKEEDAEITKRDFSLVLEFEYKDSDGFSDWGTENADFHIYTDESKENEMTTTLLLVAGQTQTLYIETITLRGSYSSSIGLYSSYILNYIELKHGEYSLKTITHRST